MKNLKTVLTALSLFALSFVTCANAQWDVGGYTNPFNEQLYAQLEQMRLQNQQQVNQAWAQVQQEYTDYYRQRTGDYATPDHEAFRLGAQLHCQDYPVQCQQQNQHWQNMTAAGTQMHQQRMADLQSLGESGTRNANTSSGILDMQHEGFMNRSAVQSAGQTNLVQGAVYGESTFTNPISGVGYSLPVYPDPNTRHTTPDGYPLSFDYQTGTWYQGDANGWWYLLNQQR